MNSPLDEEFYCTLKLVSGEEIFCIMIVDDSDPEDPILALQDPVIFTYKQYGPNITLQVEPWIKTTDEGIYFIRLSKVIYMTECHNIEMIDYYKQYLEERGGIDEEEEEIIGPDVPIDDSRRKVTRHMGYVGSVNEAKDLLEHLFTLDSEDNKESK